MKLWCILYNANGGSLFIASDTQTEACVAQSSVEDKRKHTITNGK